MGLFYDGSVATAYTDCGSGSSLDDLGALTFLMWVNPTDVTVLNGFIGKLLPGGSQGWFARIRTGGQFAIARYRATTTMTTTTTDAGLANGQWNCVGGVLDITGGNCKAYTGGLTTAMVMNAGAQTVGAGALLTEAPNNLLLGARNTGVGGGWDGVMGPAAVFNRVLTLGEMIDWQFDPRMMAGCVGLWMPGDNGTGTQTDYSGNGNNGTITGATQGANPPLRRRWVRQVMALTPSGGSASPTVALTGQAATLAQGALTVVVAATVALTGQASTAAQGTVAPRGDVTVQLTGQASTPAQGAVIAGSPTRLYLGNTAATITPAFQGAWTRTTEATRGLMTAAADASAMANQAVWASSTVGANETALARQFHSLPLVAGIAFTTSDTIKGVVRTLESATNDNIQETPVGLYVVASDGTTLQATLLALGAHGPAATEWKVSLQNERFADGDTLTSSYTTVAGDYLVLEVGGQVSAVGGTSVTGQLSFGGDGAGDLAEDETVGTALNPWFEISRTLAYITQVPLTGQASTAAQGSLTVRGDVTAQLTGQASTLAQGALVLTGDATAQLTGQAATPAQGTLAVVGSVTVQLTGQDSTMAQGTVTAEIAGVTTANLTGQAATPAQGTLVVVVSATVQLTGQAATPAQGTLTVGTGGTTTASLTGQAGTLAQGTLTITTWDLYTTLGPCSSPTYTGVSSSSPTYTVGTCATPTYTVV